MANRKIKPHKPKDKVPGVGKQTGPETVGQGTSGMITDSKTGKFKRWLTPATRKRIAAGKASPAEARTIAKGKAPSGTPPKSDQLDQFRKPQLIPKTKNQVEESVVSSKNQPLQTAMDLLRKIAVKDPSVTIDTINAALGNEPVGAQGSDVASLILGGQGALGPTGSGITGATQTPPLVSSGLAPGEINPFAGATSRVSPSLDSLNRGEFVFSKNVEFIINKKNVDAVQKITGTGKAMLSNQISGNAAKAAAGIDPTRYTRSYAGKGFSTLETWTGAGPYNRAVTNTRTAALSNSFIKNLVFSAGGVKSLIWKTFMIGAIGSYPISTSLAVNERGDAVTSLTVGMRDAENRGDMAAKEEMGQMLLDITDPSIMNVLEIVAPIINYPIAAIKKWKSARKIALLLLRKDKSEEVPEFDLSQEEILEGQQISQ